MAERQSSLHYLRLPIYIQAHVALGVRFAVSLVEIFFLKPSSAGLDFFGIIAFDLNKFDAATVINRIHEDRFDTFEFFLGTGTVGI